MKKIISLLIAMLLILSLIPSALADGVVQCVNCKVNGQYYWNVKEETTLTAIADLDSGKTVGYWTVNGRIVDGSEGQMFLIFTASGDMTVQCVASNGQTPVKDSTVVKDNTAAAAEEDTSLKVKAVGCTVKLNEKNAQATDEIDFTDAGKVDVVITATPAKGQKIAYWVLNGVKYDFYEYLIKELTVKELTYSLTAEVVYEGEQPETLHDDTFDAGEDKLIVTSVNSQMCHITAANKGAGGWFKEFDFTEDYQNRASGLTEGGGRVTVNVKSNTPDNRKILGWKINDAKFYGDSKIEMFRVYDLDTTTEYEPIFSGIYYKVTCIGCTFTGGGYTNAKSGLVPGGTKITVNAEYAYWFSEGDFSKTKNYTINKDTTIKCIYIVN